MPDETCRSTRVNYRTSPPDPPLNRFLKREVRTQRIRQLPHIFVPSEKMIEAGAQTTFMSRNSAARKRCWASTNWL
jgi:hypothetical protein